MQGGKQIQNQIQPEQDQYTNLTVEFNQYGKRPSSYVKQNNKRSKRDEEYTQVELIRKIQQSGSGEIDNQRQFSFIQMVPAQLQSHVQQNEQMTMQRGNNYNEMQDEIESYNQNRGLINQNEKQIVYLKGKFLIPQEEQEKQKMFSIMNIPYEYIQSLEIELRLPELTKVYIEQIPLVILDYYKHKYDNINYFIEYYQKKYQPQIIQKLDKYQKDAKEALKLFRNQYAYLEEDPQQLFDKHKDQFPNNWNKLHYQRLLDAQKSLIRELEAVEEQQTLQQNTLQQTNQIPNQQLSTPNSSIIEFMESELQKCYVKELELDALQVMAYNLCKDQYKESEDDQQFLMLCNADFSDLLFKMTEQN